MIHTINNKKVNIQWDIGDLIEMHDSGYADYQMLGTDDEGNEYYGCGNYQHDELIDVSEVELI